MTDTNYAHYQYRLPPLPLGLVGGPPAPPPEDVPADRTDWRDQVLYFPFTDRFCDGDPSNNQGVDRNDPLAFHGGDLQGIENRLDHIRKLGANTIWLSPLQQNSPGGYHGYWIHNGDQVEPHQGDLSKAQELVRKAHEKGMKVVLDTVLNHVGPDHPWVGDTSKTDWFHHHGDIHDYDNQWQLENCNLAGLPDWNTENPKVFDYLLQNTREWVEKTGADGVRLDAIKHAPKEFWSRFVPALKQSLNNPDLMVVGEVFHGDAGYLAGYQSAGIDTLFDIPLYYTVREVLGGGASARYLAQRLGEDHKYPHPEKLVTLLDNHDLPRFLHTAKGSPEEKVERLKMAAAFLMSVRGAPSIYYGTECALEGGGDPDNRRDMDFERRQDVQAYFGQLGRIRESHEALRKGQQLEMWQDDQVYAFARRLPETEAIAVVNASDQSVVREIPLRDGSPLREGQQLTEQIGGSQVRVEQGKIRLQMAPRAAAILTA